MARYGGVCKVSDMDRDDGTPRTHGCMMYYSLHSHVEGSTTVVVFSSKA